jgi:O-antigen ligase
LWLLPPLAIIAAILRVGAYRESWLSIALGLAAFAGVLLGVLQVTSDNVLDSPWYLYAITNNGAATGFFANTNHMATLLIVTIPFMVALLGVKRRGPRLVQQEAGRYAILGGALLVLVVGLVLNPSTAGAGLGAAVLAASLLIRSPITGRLARWGMAGVVLIGIAAILAVLATPLGSRMAAAGEDQSFSTRATSFSTSLRAVSDFFPVGSGSGSFNSIYPAYEDPDQVGLWYVNHVHNDYIEIVLETGLAGLLLILVFLFWWAGRAIAIWRAPIIDHFARAATIASAAMLAHSLVDFPLRTSAIAAVFAMTVALMASPRRREKMAKLGPQSEEGARHLSIG